MDENYWKRNYQNKWGLSEKRENDMIDWIKSNTGLTAEPSGLGAGTSQFIDGSAERNGHQKGDADLHIVNTDLYIEVTGPLTDRVSIDKPLWFRPDKFENAISNIQNGHDTFFAHHCPSKDLWRIIHIDETIVARYNRSEFKIVYPMINGAREKYVEIDSHDRCIRSLEYLKTYLLEFKNRNERDI